jgi:hypothetical protein
MTERDRYQLGWDDGYAEGYGARLVDLTELFMPAVTDAMVEAALDAQQVYWKPPWRDDPFAPERKADMRKAISAALAAAQEGA